MLAFATMSALPPILTPEGVACQKREGDENDNGRIERSGHQGAAYLG
jgi:hypothetical protein